jgi:hypothetical protein
MFSRACGSGGASLAGWPCRLRVQKTAREDARLRIF